jgi:hypothetical protein
MLRIAPSTKIREEIIPRFFDELSRLKLVYATLVRASQRWQRIRITDAERALLTRLRQQLGLPLHRRDCAHETHHYQTSQEEDGSVACTAPRPSTLTGLGHLTT